MAVVIWTFVALLAAVAVFVVVSASAGAGTSVTAFRRGLRGHRHPDADQAEAARAAAERPVDLSLADFLRATASEGDGYLHPDELAGDLRSARERAAHVLRPRREAEPQGASR
ncbi:hypothetical protein [Cellulomonas sp. S1-8]|uniref:hypothetical protein n=1 Tax=Cellulomonas sp. S1-8 TaxID=2904790 RepID=UPI0022436EAB|nr:hypothetical protein [Cellulomonas sp. S1-8]UZN04821.1 hypothetical protein OKX07_07945 [Cellulomonas sp. S1-8]